jgi:proteic killer suppression protein
MGVRDCRHKGLKELYSRGHSARIGVRYAKNALLILDFLSGIAGLKDCEGVKDFHELKGNRKGTYSMHVTGNYCITFKWDGRDVYDMDFEDYH